MATKMRSGGLAATLTVAAIPAFVLSQWVTVRWGAPLRAVFNAGFLGMAFIILVQHRARLLAFRREVVLGAIALGTVAVSALAGWDSASVAAQGAIPYVGAVLVLLAALSAPLTDEQVGLGALIAAWTVAAMAVIAVIQLVIGRPGYVATFQDIAYPRWWERGRATGLVGNPGRLGQLGVLTIAVAPLTGRRSITFALVAAVAVAASGSRMAVLVAVGALIAWPVLRSPGARRSTLAGAVAVVVALAVVQLAVPEARNDFWGRTSALVTEATTPDGSDRDIRVENFRAGLDAWQASPLVGWGPGRFGSTTAWRYDSELHERFGLPDVRSEAALEDLTTEDPSIEIDVGVAQLDVGWLQIATELGALGVLSFAGLLTSVAWRALRSGATATLLLVFAISVLTLGSPGIVDLSLAAVFLWWSGVALGGEKP